MERYRARCRIPSLHLRPAQIIEQSQLPANTNASEPPALPPFRIVAGLLASAALYTKGLFATPEPSDAGPDIVSQPGGGIHHGTHFWLTDGISGFVRLDPAAADPHVVNEAYERAAASCACFVAPSRPSAVALGPDGNLYAGFLTSGNIVRLPVARCLPPACQAPAPLTIGKSVKGGRVNGLAFIGGDPTSRERPG